MARKKTPTAAEKEAQLRKNIALMKAQNELMDYAAQSVMEHHRRVSNDDAPPEVLNMIEEAKRENHEAAMSLLNLTPEEVSQAEYTRVSGEYEAKYAEHLKKRNLTDAEVHRKDAPLAAELADDVEYGDTIDRARLEQAYADGLFDGDQTPSEPAGPDFNDDISTGHGYTATKSEVEAAMNFDFDDSLLSDGEDRIDYDDAPEADDSAVGGYDFSAIANNSDFDIIPIPSKGECYRHKKSHIAVSFLNAEDENVITSPNLYKDGKVIDVLLSRKIIDKDVNPQELCNGDRDAIILWLRATGYGADFPIKVRDPKDGEELETVVHLDKINFRPFALEGDENGLFSYVTKSNDLIKFKFQTNDDTVAIRKNIVKRTAQSDKEGYLAHINSLKDAISEDRNLPKAEKEKLYVRLLDIEKWAKKTTDDDTPACLSQVTDSMLRAIQSVNGNSDRKFIANYVRKMRAREALDFRTYMKDHEPGMDFRISVKRPESRGGGSFDTFLNVDDFIFLGVS